MVKGVALGFLGATCGLYAILADIRNCPGVTPTRRLKWWENWLWSEKPARGDLCQGEVAALLQELLRPPDAMRKAIDQTNALGDPDTADLFMEVSRGSDKWLWLVEAHRHQ